MNITNQQLKEFQNIVNKYQGETEFPISNNWELKSNNELWLWLIGQVMVVGGIGGNERFSQRDDLQKKLNYTSLKQYVDDTDLQIIINEVLRDAGVRYASSEIEKCKKSKALVHNFKFISNFKGDFKGLLAYLNKMTGVNAEQERVSYLIRHLMYIKNKSARDFLMSMGINKNTLALDIRIQNIFKFLNIEFPTQGGLAIKNIYDATEKEIIEKICTPLKIAPVNFDRILFNNYKDIVKNSFE